MGDIDTRKNRYDETYFLRIKNKGMAIVDPSWGGIQCSLWNEKTGCPLPFEKRPKGARALVPDSVRPCLDGYSKEMCVMDWRKHHTVLKRLREYFGK